MHNFIRLLTCILITSCATLPPPGEDILYVRVYDDTGNPVQSAEIILNNSHRQIFTDSYGRASIALLGLESPISLTVNHLAYIPINMEIEVSKDSQVLFITLKSRAVLIQKSYQLSAFGHMKDALEALSSEPEFIATGLKEQFYMALLYYLNGEYTMSREMLGNISEPIMAKSLLLNRITLAENLERENRYETTSVR